jgi:hypothetical protein
MCGMRACAICAVPDVAYEQVQCAHNAYHMFGLQVKAGHQVEYLKAWLGEQPDILQGSKVKLLYKDKEMIDPLSFMDYADIAAAGSCTVTVQLLD